MYNQIWNPKVDPYQLNINNERIPLSRPTINTQQDNTSENNQSDATNNGWNEPNVK